MNSPQLNEFKTTHRYVPSGNVDTKPRGIKIIFLIVLIIGHLLGLMKKIQLIDQLVQHIGLGFFNTYFTIDFKNEFALVYMTQIYLLMIFIHIIYLQLMKG